MIFESSAVLELEEIEDLLFNGYKFRGATINEWISKLKFPELSTNPPPDEVVLANLRIIEIIEIVTENYSKSLSMKKTAEFKYKTRYNESLRDFLNGLSSSNPPKRAPSSDVMESIIVSRILHEHSLKVVSELHFDFWKSQLEKIEMMNQRLGSISYLNSR